MSNPPKPGRRERGGEMTRVETFTDAAFAFAVTMLIVTLDFPSSYDELASALWNVPVFVASFALLLVFWWGHYDFSRKYGLEDGPTIVLSAVLVCVVLIYIFPLRFLMAAFAGWARWRVLGGVGGPPVEITPAELANLFVIYGVGFVLLSTVVGLLFVHAYRKRGELGLSEIERFEARASIASWAILVSVGVASILMAIVLPTGLSPLAGWAYGLLAVIMPLFGARTGRRQRSLEASSSSA